MASSREISARMNSIRDTMKITNAMYMISSSKHKKATEALENAIPHFNAVAEDIERLQRHMPDNIENLYFADPFSKKENPKAAYVVITADKGLAGAYNQNVVKFLKNELARRPEAEYRLFVVGQVGRDMIQKQGMHIEEHFQYTAQNPSVHRARVISGHLLEAYRAGLVDEVFIIYSKMVNAVECMPVLYQMLPLKRTRYEETGILAKDDFEYLPSPADVFHSLIPNYMTGYLYGALVESFACEQNARMIAMQGASDSASEMLRTLQVDYNRARQAAITQEITEVSSGARAQKAKRRTRSHE